MKTTADDGRAQQLDLVLGLVRTQTTAVRRDALERFVVRYFGQVDPGDQRIDPGDLAVGDRRQGVLEVDARPADADLDVANTNLGSNVSVLLNETLDELAIKPGGRYIDGTVGGGCHSEAIL